MTDIIPAGCKRGNDKNSLSLIQPPTHSLTHRYAAHCLSHNPNLASLQNLLASPPSSEGWICNRSKWRNVERLDMTKRSHASLNFKKHNLCSVIINNAWHESRVWHLEVGLELQLLLLVEEAALGGVL